MLKFAAKGHYLRECDCVSSVKKTNTRLSIMIPVNRGLSQKFRFFLFYALVSTKSKTKYY